MFKQYLTGGLAATAALVPMVAPAIAHAAPAEAPLRAPDRPSVDPATLESCTAVFGLTKSNSLFLSFDQTVAGDATPAPHIGDGLTFYVTADDGSGPQDCVPELAWSNADEFATWMGKGASFLVYPGGGYYLMPQQNGSGIPIAVHLALDASHASDWTLDWDHEIDPDAMNGDGVLLAAAKARLRTLLPDDVLVEFDAIPGMGCNSLESGPLADALLELLGGAAVAAELNLTTPCNVYSVLLIREAMSEVYRLGTVAVTVTDTSEVVGAMPATGTDMAPLALTATALTALGGALMFSGRRRRRQFT